MGKRRPVYTLALVRLQGVATVVITATGDLCSTLLKLASWKRIIHNAVRLPNNASEIIVHVKFYMFHLP